MTGTLKKLTALFFMAATILTFISCSKDDAEEKHKVVVSKVSEADLVGEWGWPSYHPLNGSKILIKGDHTALCRNYSYTWTLEGNTFTAKNPHKMVLEFTVDSLAGDRMFIIGTETYGRSNGAVSHVNDISGLIVKSVSTQYPELNDSIMIGTWHFEGADSGYYDRYDITINYDHSFSYHYSKTAGTWKIDGSTFIGTRSDGDTVYSFTVARRTSSAWKVVMKAVDGMDNEKTFTGTFSRDLFL